MQSSSLTAMKNAVEVVLLVWIAISNCRAATTQPPTTSGKGRDGNRVTVNERSAGSGGSGGGGVPRPFINASYVQALEDYLLSGPAADSTSGIYYYNHFLRPNTFGNLNISVEFYLLGIVYTDEKQGWVGMSGVYILRWKDDRLTWNPNDFGNINYLDINSKMVWLPSFIHNGHFQAGANEMSKVTVSNDGTMVAMLNFNDDVPCQFDLAEFPRDSQSCSIHLLHEDPLVKFVAGSSITSRSGVINEDIMKDINHRRSWKVTNTSLTFDFVNAGMSFPMISVKVEMQRQSSFFLKVYVAPTCFLLLLMPLIFLLPPDSPEKLTYGALLLFSMIYISDRVDHIYPPDSQAMPRIVKLNIASSCLLFLCILLTSLIASLERIGRTKPLPAWVKRYILGVIGPYIMVRENPNLTSHGTVHVSSLNDDDSAAIVENEQTLDLQKPQVGAPNGGTSLAESSIQRESNKALNSLVYELRKSRLNDEANEGWLNVFTIVDRLLFLITLFVAVIIMFCYA